jgi:hypothetical protein
MIGSIVGSKEREDMHAATKGGTRTLLTVEIVDTSDWQEEASYNRSQLLSIKSKD